MKWSIHNGRLINDLLIVTIFLNAENTWMNLSRKWSEINQFYENFDPQGICIVYWQFLQKLFSRHFWRPSWISEVNAKHIYLDEIFDLQGVCGVYWRLFAKIVLLPLLAAVLNFCVKRQNVFISEMERDRAISAKFLTRMVSAESTGDFSQKSFSCHFWRPSWIFSQNAFILMKFLTCRVSAECTGDFSQKSFSHHFWWTSWISV